MNFFSLKQEERLSPSETSIQKNFYDQTNVTRVLAMVRERIDNFYSQGDVVDVMHTVFTQFLGENFNVSFSSGIVDKLNDAVVAQVRRRKMASNKASKISRKVGFETNKIPGKFLPRPSFSLESEDEDRGKVSYEFI